MSKMIEYRLEGQERSEEACFDEFGKIKIGGLVPNAIYQIKEKNEDWSCAKRYRADANGVIKGQSYDIRK